GKQLVKIPTPRFAVFYNGLEKRPEIETLLLSDAYEQPVENPELELICTVYNINVGYNRELLKQCPVLKKYMVFIDRVRYNVRRLQKASMNNPYLLANDKQILEQAINEAINYCITHHILEDFFREHRWEVEKAMTLDYTYERRMELNREEGFSEGLDQGISQGVQESILNLMQTMKWSMEQAMDALCIPEDERSRYHS
ncbi:MAG: hypothetical protein IJ079_10015, partial [Lachnospiraceae bacterium]|nr:hypothetical protein [Lachnospiraceae bacterium]